MSQDSACLYQVSNLLSHVNKEERSNLHEILLSLHQSIKFVTTQPPKHKLWQMQCRTNIKLTTLQLLIYMCEGKLDIYLLEIFCRLVVTIDHEFSTKLVDNYFNEIYQLTKPEDGLTIVELIMKYYRKFFEREYVAIYDKEPETYKFDTKKVERFYCSNKFKFQRNDQFYELMDNTGLDMYAVNLDYYRSECLTHKLIKLLAKKCAFGLLEILIAQLKNSISTSEKKIQSIAKIVTYTHFALGFKTTIADDFLIAFQTPEFRSEYKFITNELITMISTHIKQSKYYFPSPIIETQKEESKEITKVDPKETEDCASLHLLIGNKLIEYDGMFNFDGMCYTINNLNAIVGNEFSVVYIRDNPNGKKTRYFLFHSRDVQNKELIHDNFKLVSESTSMMKSEKSLFNKLSENVLNCKQVFIKG